MMVSLLFLAASAELQALDQAVAQCDRKVINPAFSSESDRRSKFLLDAYREQEAIVAARLDLSARRRLLREAEAKNNNAEEDRAIALEHALIEDRQRALNDQRMLEGLRQSTIDAMRRHYLTHCATGKSKD
jgi:hypothetical protein